MTIAENRQPLTLSLTFFDGSRMNYTFDPGELHYNSRTGLVVSFDLAMADGMQTHVAIKPRTWAFGVAEFLAPFGLNWSAGSKFRAFAGKNVFTSLGAFLVIAAASAPVIAYLKEIETSNSSYYTLDDKHKMIIKEPIYLR